MQMFYFIYHIALWPLLRALFTVLSFSDAKVRLGLELRKADLNGVDPWLKSPQIGWQPVWIHCASGEFEYAKPVITKLKKKYPSQGILVTYFSPSYKDSIARFPGVDFSCPLPWDTAQDFKAFLNHHKPRALLIARTDVWPEMIRQTHLAGIPSLLFSATLTSDSGRARGIGRLISKITFSQLSEIFCVSISDQKEFASLDLNIPLQVSGDTRFDQVIARLESPQPLREELFKSRPEREFVLVCGSTWPEDEAVMLSAVKALGNVGMILVPHEPSESHLANLESQMKELEIQSRRYSNASDWYGGEVLLIDRTGILAELYSKADIAFVGGSFRRTVHSVMEPLAAGCFTLIGPHHLNNREAIEFQSIRCSPDERVTVLNIVEMIKNKNDLIGKISSFMQFPNGVARSKVKDEIRARSGKSEHVVSWIENHLKGL